MATFIELDDLTPFLPDVPSAKLAAMLEDAVARAILEAPALDGDLTDTQIAGARSVVRQAIIRWDASGGGAFQQQTNGPFSVVMDTRQVARSLFTQAEIDALRSIAEPGRRTAYVGWLA